MQNNLILIVGVVLLALTSCVSPEAPVKSETATVEKQYWNVVSDNKIVFKLDDATCLPYEDNIEMSGKRVAGIVTYSIDTLGILTLDREIFFPQLHEFKPEGGSWFHDYRAYLKGSYSDGLLAKLYINNEKFIPGSLSEVSIDGMLNFVHKPSKNGIALSRSFFPSMDERMFVEMWTIKNTTKDPVEILSGNTSLSYVDYGGKGKFTRLVTSDAPEKITLAAGEEFSFSNKIMAKMNNEKFPSETTVQSLALRKEFLSKMAGSLKLETPNQVLNTLFEFSKVRASESIFESELGLIHSPGGGRYYVGIWANDQAEYINPFFPYLGYDIGNESAMSAFRAFAKETTPDYKNIRYSFEVEGLVKPFPKDRGDAAMIAYGAAHYALALGDEKIANELWPLIEWCNEYSNRQLNEGGVVASESDEMEGRIETGNANLSTSALYYGALEHSADLAKALGKSTELIEKYNKQRKDLHSSIESYFGANVEGLDTYKYYAEHKHLRHWICLPLVVGINDRADATIEALFDRLWTDNGVHVEKNSEDPNISKIFWDRGTLYALRGTFCAGATEVSLEKLEQFSSKRLIGDRVPYVVEAYPEGNMAHLSAESALYCRVFTEGMFGIKPVGFNALELKPRLPKEWNNIALRNVKAFNSNFDIEVSRKDAKLEVKILSEGKVVDTQLIEDGASCLIKL